MGHSPLGTTGTPKRDERSRLARVGPHAPSATSDRWPIAVVLIAFVIVVMAVLTTYINGRSSTKDCGMSETTAKLGIPISPMIPPGWRILYWPWVVRTWVLR